MEAADAQGQDVLEIQRPTVNFSPGIWKDHFLSLNSDVLKIEDELKEQAEKLKEEIRKMLNFFVGKPLEKLRMIDSIQRLGVSYHFENEIDKALEQIYNNLDDNGRDEDLNTLALKFRLLRQQGYTISCDDMFIKYKENNGKFKKSLEDDARGILSLYEATHMRIHGEDIMEEALDFTINHLKKLVPHLKHPLTNEISNALKSPLRKTFPRVQTREYLLIYQQDPSHNDALLTFSKLDFNILQILHQKELSEITRWWKELDFAMKLSFARDRIVECYFWALGVYYEPQFYFGRKITTKVLAMTSVLDDIYDAYGTFEELKLFTHAIERWDINMVEQLPDYMKVFYKALFDLYEESEKELGRDRIHFAREAMKKQARFYFNEAEWLHKGYKPALEEYLQVAFDSSGYSLVVTTCFLGMGEMATIETFEWTTTNPKVIKASTVIARLMDDIVSNEFEQEREHIGSAVQCYMEEYGCSRDEACVELNKQVSDAWKDINEACLNPTEIPMILLDRILNLSRVMNLFYSSKDGYTNSDGRTKTYVQSVLIDPIPLLNN